MWCVYGVNYDINFFSSVFFFVLFFLLCLFFLRKLVTALPTTFQSLPSSRRVRIVLFLSTLKSPVVIVGISHLAGFIVVRAPEHYLHHYNLNYARKHNVCLIAAIYCSCFLVKGDFYFDKSPFLFLCDTLKHFSNVEEFSY